jgi:hypothetical protein
MSSHKHKHKRPRSSSSSSSSSPAMAAAAASGGSSKARAAEGEPGPASVMAAEKAALQALIASKNAASNDSIKLKTLVSNVKSARDFKINAATAKIKAKAAVKISKIYQKALRLKSSEKTKGTSRSVSPSSESSDSSDSSDSSSSIDSHVCHKNCSKTLRCRKRPVSNEADSDEEPDSFRFNYGLNAKD